MVEALEPRKAVLTLAIDQDAGHGRGSMHGSHDMALKQQPDEVQLLSLAVSGAGAAHQMGDAVADHIRVQNVYGVVENHEHACSIRQSDDLPSVGYLFLG